MKHGTRSGYIHHHCRCDECRNAHRVACAAERARRAAKPVPNGIHGRLSTYSNWLCRCTPCTEAMRFYHGRSEVVPDDAA